MWRRRWPALRKRVALVIGSGNLKCVAAIGLMKVLIREGIPVDLAVGCSGGSIYAAMIALGYSLDQFLDLTTRFWTRDVYSHYHFRALLRALLPRVFGYSERLGLLDDRLILRALKSVFGDHTFADTRIPLYMVATDLYTGEKVILSEGRIVDAIRASAAIPVIFRPWRIGDHLLIDGGASDPLPVDVAIREGSEIILAMGFEAPYRDSTRTLPALIGQTSTIMMNNLIRSTYAFHNLAHHAEIIPVIPHFARPVGLADTHLVPYMIEEGARVAEEQVPYLRRLLAVPA